MDDETLKTVILSFVIGSFALIFWMGAMRSRDRHQRTSRRRLGRVADQLERYRAELRSQSIDSKQDPGSAKDVLKQCFQEAWDKSKLSYLLKCDDPSNALNIPFDKYDFSIMRKDGPGATDHFITQREPARCATFFRVSYHTQDEDGDSVIKRYTVMALHSPDIRFPRFEIKSGRLSSDVELPNFPEALKDWPDFLTYTAEEDVLVVHGWERVDREMDLDLIGLIVGENYAASNIQYLNAWKTVEDIQVYFEKGHRLINALSGE